MKISFVLVRAQTSANIGAAARALKTMGIEDFRLVEPCEFSDEAAYLAHGARDVLENAKVFTSLQEAVADVQVVLGTTARKRSFGRSIVSSKDLRSFLVEKHGHDISFEVLDEDLVYNRFDAFSGLNNGH